ncbi:MAG: Gfo/Idh/MocA family oxidoreductase [Pseudomonadota bacterium]
MTNFGLIGAAGYIAPRHMRAIRDVGGDLKVAYDPNDSVGIIDSHFPHAEFFTEFEAFDRHVSELRRQQVGLDYIAVCSPNYLHEAHTMHGLRSGAHVICEKPLVLNPGDLENLARCEADTGRRVFSILQLRLHPTVNALRDRIAASRTRHNVDLTYITSRGRWYHASWKGDDRKSGGVATNIGVHFFDMLQYVFGPVLSSEGHLRDASRAAGAITFEKADVRWFLSLDSTDLPESVRGAKTTYRSVLIDGEELEFSDGFTDLHSVSYEAILAGKGYGLDDVRPSIELVSHFRTAELMQDGSLHPSAERHLSGAV